MQLEFIEMKEYRLMFKGPRNAAVLNHKKAENRSAEIKFILLFYAVMFLLVGKCRRIC